MGVVERLEPRAGGARITIRPGSLPVDELVPGESVACNGACLTVVERGGGRMSFDAVPETLSRTTLGTWKPGTRVNLERALRLSDRLGGHLVQGHVDAVGKVLARVAEGQGARLTVWMPPAIAPLVAEKGSIAIDGVSLTVAERRARPVRGGAHPGDARPHRAGRRGAGDRGEPGGRRGGPPRGPASRVRRHGRRHGGFVEGLGIRRGGGGDPPLGARGRADRGGPRGAAARQDDHPRRRRGPRERGRPLHRRREGDAGGGELHGQARPRPHLPGPDRREGPLARPAAHGPGGAERLQLRHRLHGLHRGGPRRHHRDQRQGPGPHHPHRRGPGRQAHRPGPPRPRLPAAGPGGRRAGARRPDRGLGGPGPAGRAEPGRRSSARS